MMYQAHIILLVLLAMRVQAEEPAPRPGAVLFQNACAQCHGAKGEGNPVFHAPAIGGLPIWYVRQQIENFRAGRRGAHEKDVPGQLMRAMSLSLDEPKIADAAAFVAALPQANPLATIKADTTIGARLYAERCAECHRYNGSGELVFGSAPLAGLPDWYLLSQLQKFKNGQRGTAPGDVNGQKMVLAASYIEDEATMKSVVACIISLGETKTSSSNSSSLQQAPQQLPHFGD
jgi:cytochrome c553